MDPVTSSTTPPSETGTDAAASTGIAPDTRDWTFVITEGCPECGFTPFDPAATPVRLRASIPRWQEVLARPDADRRPDDSTWSATEYGCHVRDVCRVFATRLDLMVTSTELEAAHFPNWDQDEAAIAGDYAHADAAEVAHEYHAAATDLADAWDQVDASDRRREGLRSNGSRFTVDTLGIYLVHDIEHHLHDVQG